MARRGVVAAKMSLQSDRRNTIQRQVRDEHRGGASGVKASMWRRARLVPGLLLYVITLKVLRAHAQTNC